MASKSLCFVLYVIGFVQICQSLVCNPQTLNTCTKSLYVTGNCVSGECECVSGALPDKYGCVMPTKPTLSLKINTGYGEIDESRWSQEGSPGYYEFHCSPELVGDRKYRWFRNDVELETSGNSQLRIYVSVSTWRFQCALNVEGLANDKSDHFVLTVKRNGEPFTTKPNVTGIPMSAALNSVFQIFCSNIPSFLGSFVFNIDGKEKKEIFPQTYVNMTTDTFGKNVTCSLKPEMQTWSVTSDPVTLPAAPASDIPEVVVEGKSLYYDQEYLLLKCVMKESFEPESGVPIEFEWMGPTGGNTGEYYYKKIVSSSDAGQYICKASYQNQTAKTSPEFQVSVVDLGSISLLAKPEKPVIGGYMSLICSPSGSSLSSPLYSWDFLPPYTDNVVQFNAIDTGELGQWMSCDFKLRGKYGQSKYISVPLPMSDIPQPTIEGVSENVNSDLYTMKCNSEYGTPGANVEWYVDDVKQDNENSNTFEFFQSDVNNVSEIRCRLSFNSKYSGFSKNATIPTKGSIATPIIEAKYSPRSFIAGASYTFLCSSVIQTKASYSWKKNGVKLDTNNHFLMYQGVDDSTNGNYTCTVTLGDIVKESEPFQVVVQDHIEAPVIEIAGSSFQGDYGGLKILEKGRTYYLRCSTPAHSDLARYSWMKGSNFVNVPDNILRLQDVDVWDFDLFSCEISLGGKKGKSAAVAIVVGHDAALPKVEVSGNPWHFIAGGNYTLVCVNYMINSLRSITKFNWKKDNKLISAATDQFYNLNNIQDEDKGSYKCSITIGAKSFESETPISVAFSKTGKFCNSDKDCLAYIQGGKMICQAGVCLCSRSGDIFDGDTCHGNSLTFSCLLLVLTIICFKYFTQF